MKNHLPENYILRGKAHEYKIAKVLGQGTFGITYLATTKMKVEGGLGSFETNINVAIKEFFMKDINGREGTKVVIGTDSELYHNYRKDFIREVENLSKLKHPNIIKVIEFFEDNNTAYFSMEYIDGGNLDDYIQLNNGLSEYDALCGMAQMAEALSLMHDNKMLHLDLKPRNIMRREDGELVLIDFGLSKQFNSNGEPESSSRIGAGTMGYAPIEQSNYKKQDGFPPTLDIYALGATLYKTLTGITPPDASTVFNEGFPDDVMRNRGVSEEVIILTSWAMEPMKRKRPQTMMELKNEINRLLPFVSDKAPQPININKPHVIEQNLYGLYDELCNGFQVRWSKDLSEYKKTKIRELLCAMRYIGDKKISINSEYGPKTIDTKAVMSLGDNTWSDVSPLLGEDTGRIFSSRTIRNAIKIIHQLEIWTGLPFRLSTNEEQLRFGRTIPGYLVNIPPTLCYSPERGLQYRTHDRVNYLSDDMWRYDEFDMQIVCDGFQPVYVNNRFDISNTQPLYDEIQPVGFSLYAVRKNKLWNITSPQSPLASFLPEDYDTISAIGVWHIPGPGPNSGTDFIGVVTEKDDITSYYRFTTNRFTLIKSYTSKELRERELWT